jgi:hypothetical protein
LSNGQGAITIEREPTASPDGLQLRFRPLGEQVVENITLKSILQKVAFVTATLHLQIFQNATNIRCIFLLLIQSLSCSSLPEFTAHFDRKTKKIAPFPCTLAFEFRRARGVLENQACGRLPPPLK